MSAPTLPFHCQPGGGCAPSSSTVTAAVPASTTPILSYAPSETPTLVPIATLRAQAASRGGVSQAPFAFPSVAKQNVPDMSRLVGHKTPFIKSNTFDPESVGLSKDFILTDYTKLKGCSCKVPQPKLLELLRAVNTNPGERGGNVGMDCSIVPLGKTRVDSATGERLYLVSTTDYFFPSVEDPYLQGRIGAANVLSDMYSMGITNCDSMLMLLAASTEMDEGDKYASTLMIMKGYADTCREAGVDVTGGQTVMNPWPLIGGVAMSVVPPSEMIPPSGALRVGDVIVLTKPIGNQIAVNCKQWVQRPSPWYVEFIEGRMTVDEIDHMYLTAAANMSRLNRHAATLMLKHKAHAATDITGFGLLGHAANLVEAQHHDDGLAIAVHTIPTLAGAAKASVLLQDKYKLFEGTSAETSGGLFVALDSEATARAFIADLKALDTEFPEAWIVGTVVDKAASGGRHAYFTDDANVLLV